MVNDNELNEEQLRTLIGRYKGVYDKEGKMFPQEPLEQMRWGLAPTHSESSFLDLNDIPCHGLGLSLADIACACHVIDTQWTPVS